MLADDSNWPYLAQVFKLEDWCKDTQTGKVTTAVRYGVTSAPVTVLDARGLLTATREHWGIETGLHSRRDGSLGEDGMRTRTGQAPHVLATLNTVVLSILGRQGITNVVEAQRSIAYHLDRFLHQVPASRRAEAMTYSKPIGVVAWSRGFSRIGPPKGSTPFHNLCRLAIADFATAMRGRSPPLTPATLLW